MPVEGSIAMPLRVAIIGSGPSAFYAAEHLLKQNGKNEKSENNEQPDLTIEVDMFERLPTPYGLVRGGVAPDHAKIKSVTKAYEKIAANPNFRFYGNVEFGKDITRADLKAHYHRIIYAVGAQSDRRMGIPGEDLPGSYAATEFVGWYNAHPDYRHLHFDLSAKRVAVIGNGNVAMDVARILAKTYDELKGTDIADYALEALRHSQIEEIYVLGRRGPAQAAFTNPELKELGDLEATEVVLRADEIALDPLSEAALAADPDPLALKNLKTLNDFVQRPLGGKPRQIHMRFLVSPVEILGNERVEAIHVVRNELYTAPDGSVRPRPTDEYETLSVDLVFRSIGYMGVALPDLPFDARAGIIPNQNGRVVDPATGQVIPGEYVVGWIKRGPTGVIGTNKPDAQETVNLMLQDNLPEPAHPTREALEHLVWDRKPDYVTFDDWQAIDVMEIANGQVSGRSRLKFSRVDDMLDALRESKRLTAAAD
jgi:ferredoxin/flavodoxin---NADP+ reductase